MAEAASRRTAVLIFQILLAVLFLAGIGAGGGYALGDAARKHTVKVATSPTPAPPGSNSPSVSSGTTPCPEVTEEEAKRRGSPGGLVQVFYLLTGSDGTPN